MTRSMLVQCVVVEKGTRLVMRLDSADQDVLATARGLVPLTRGDFFVWHAVYENQAINVAGYHGRFCAAGRAIRSFGGVRYKFA